LAHDAGIPCVSFATAASMNGYASANVAPTLAGVKSLLRARPPHAVLASPEILCAAPRELTTAGLGDVLAKCTSSADWRMNHLLFGDYYCARSVGLIVEIEPLYLEHPEAVAAGDARAVGALFDALLRTGVAMTMAESSAPASGGEHLISHTLDMLAVAAGGEHDLHGRQVGVGTILMCELYRRVLAVESPKFRAPPATIDARFWGKLAGAVAPCYAEKRPRLAVAAGALAKAGAWDRLRAELAPMLRPPEQVRDCLARAGGATTASDIGCDKRALAEILRRAREVRARFTILDLADLLGILDAAAGEIVQQWG
ncbi:MAG TPA: hypothetical protein DCX07_07295, partial [Phycisphaerales bacterium]|nr:hypothetical protein [Phycisphaerales bacterium]